MVASEGRIRTGSHELRQEEIGPAIPLQQRRFPLQVKEFKLERGDKPLVRYGKKERVKRESKRRLA